MAESWSRSALFVRVQVAFLAVATALSSFDARHHAIRLGTNVLPDALVHYNMLLTWWRHGDSLTGYTLTPSPYFIDLLLQLPIALVAPDFEVFSYGLAVGYALLILASLWFVLRAVLGASWTFTLLVAGVAIAASYACGPCNVVVHAFVVNHTSELFTTLGLLAITHAWFRPGARRRRHAAFVYPLLVAACVASSPFFIATYCIPVTLAAAALLGTRHLEPRRLARFVGLTAIGALAGLLAIAIVSRYAWPVRGDAYQRWWKSYLAFKASIVAEPGGLRAACATIAACLASIGLVVVGRRRGWAAPLIFGLAFVPAATAACIVLPIKRGAFDGSYAFRYVQLPWLLAVTFYVAVIAQLARWLVRRYATRWQAPWLPWTSAVLGLVGIVRLASCHGALAMDDDRSLMAPAIRCFRDVDRQGELKDGLSTWWLARYVTAARHAWGSDHVIVSIRTDARIDPWDNNLLWFRDGFRGGRGEANFLVTLGLDDQVLGTLRDRIGAPDRTVHCDAPVCAASGFDLWIWQQPEPRRRLTQMLLADNLRSPFSPAVGATRMAIDPTWGMVGGELTRGHRIWRRAALGPDNERAFTNPREPGVGDSAGGGPPSWGPALSIQAMWLPSGSYRLELDVATSGPPGDAEPAFDVVVHQDRHGVIARIPIASGGQATVAFPIENRGGATSGDAISIDLIPRSAVTLDVSGATLTLVSQPGISPFQIFR